MPLYFSVELFHKMRSLISPLNWETRPQWCCSGKMWRCGLYSPPAWIKALAANTPLCWAPQALGGTYIHSSKIARLYIKFVDVSKYLHAVPLVVVAVFLYDCCVHEFPIAWPQHACDIYAVLFAVSTQHTCMHAHFLNARDTVAKSNNCDAIIMVNICLHPCLEARQA